MDLQLKSEEKAYSPAQKPKKWKTRVIALATLLASSAFMFAGCLGDGTPQKPNNPNNSTNPPVTTPVEPSNPSTPSTPSNPTTPTDPTPENPDTPNPPAQEWKVEEHITELMNKLEPTLNLLALRTNNNAQLKEVKRIWLAKSEGSNIIDSVGAVFTATQGSNEWLDVSELKRPVTKDLTYQDICENGLTYAQKNTSVKTQYFNNAVRSTESQYQATAETVLSQTFGSDYTNSDWSCWKMGTGPQGDNHTIVILNDNKIEEQLITVYHAYGVGVAEAVEQNFKGKEPSSSTYRVVSTKEVEIPSDALDIQKLLEKNTVLELSF